jgi:hypothetical protein
MGSLPSAFSLPSYGDGGGETKAGLMDQQMILLMMTWSLPLPKKDGKGS